MTGPLILLVEDHSLLAIAFEAILVDAGFCVVHAATPDEATHLIDTNIGTVSVIVTDIQLGGQKTGWDIASHARTLNAAIPIVYMTGDRADDWSARGVPDSVLLQKPFADVQLTNALSLLLNTRHVSDR
jgi:CheY-like chemotaxis protein